MLFGGDSLADSEYDVRFLRVRVCGCTHTLTLMYKLTNELSGNSTVLDINDDIHNCKNLSYIP